MSLIDDVERYARNDNTTTIYSVVEGLESEYYLVKLAELQPVGIRDGHYSIAGVKLQHESRDLGLLEVDRDYAIAVYEFAKARESEAAVLARRRDELAHELYKSAYGQDAILPNYEVASEAIKVAIDRIIELEDSGGVMTLDQELD